MPGVSIDRTDRLVVISQSWFQAWTTCQRRAAYDAPTDSDAILLGDLVHASIEALLSGGQAVDLAEYAARFEALGDSRRHRIKTFATLTAAADEMLASWAEHIWPQLGDIQAVEETRRRPIGAFDADGHGWEVILEGTPDLVADHTVWDWKTTSGHPAVIAQRWAEKAAESPQADAYLILVPEAEHFLFAVLQRRTAPLVLGAERAPARIERTRVMMVQAAAAYEHWERTRHHLSVNAHHALCSEKWCPAWSGCPISRAAGGRPSSSVDERTS